MSDTFDDKTWDRLIARIKAGNCIPFLGAGASYGFAPLGGEIAESWAQKYDYPFEDRWNLSKVAQFVATDQDAMWPKEELQRQFLAARSNRPDFDDVDEPHAVLADLPLKIFVTTNYDDFMCSALEHKNKRPRREFHRWNSAIQNHTSVFDENDSYEPDESNPLVYHIHGHDDVAESMVLTEDDYLDFLVSMVQDKEDRLLEEVTSAMGKSTLLFLGYSLADMNFRVLFRSIVQYATISTRRSHFSVQLIPVEHGAPEEQKTKARQYLDNYFQDLDISVFWGTCRNFFSELRKRWEASQ